MAGKLIWHVSTYDTVLNSPLIFPAITCGGLNFRWKYPQTDLHFKKIKHYLYAVWLFKGAKGVSYNLHLPSIYYFVD